MRILHYTPSLDRTWGGTAFYMQLLTKELGRLVELHVASHASMNELMMEHCTVHRLSSWKNIFQLKQEWKGLLDCVSPDIVHINCCWTPSCALLQRWRKHGDIRSYLHLTVCWNHGFWLVIIGHAKCLPCCSIRRLLWNGQIIYMLRR